MHIPQRRLSTHILLGWLVFAASAASANWLHLPLETVNLVAGSPSETPPRFPGALFSLSWPLLHQLGVSQGQDWSPFSPLHAIYVLPCWSQLLQANTTDMLWTPVKQFLSSLSTFDLKFIVNYLSPIFLVIPLPKWDIPSSPNLLLNQSFSSSHKWFHCPLASVKLWELSSTLFWSPPNHF